jgi:molybdenum cofactor cytidylyltransferase
MRTFAVIPAAGKSTRMGRPKLVLPLGGSTVLERVIDTLRQAGVEQIVVILGPDVADLSTGAEAAGARVLLLPEQTPDMRTTVEHGLRWLEEEFHPDSADWWLLAPADHPALEPAVVRDVLQARTSASTWSIIIPACNGRRGHPALISWRHVAGIRALPPEVGIDAYLRAHSNETLELAVVSEGVLVDLDTPRDYEMMVRRFQT